MCVRKEKLILQKFNCNETVTNDALLSIKHVTVNVKTTQGNTQTQ